MQKNRYGVAPVGDDPRLVFVPADPPNRAKRYFQVWLWRLSLSVPSVVSGRWVRRSDLLTEGAVLFTLGASLAALCSTLLATLLK